MARPPHNTPSRVPGVSQPAKASFHTLDLLEGHTAPALDGEVFEAWPDVVSGLVFTTYWEAAAPAGISGRASSELRSRRRDKVQSLEPSGVGMQADLGGPSWYPPVLGIPLHSPFPVFFFRSPHPF